MTISRVQAVPTELPRARLYLDDVAEIIRILEEAANLPNPARDPLVLELTVDETKLCDDVNDLPKIGKCTKDLAIDVSRGYQFKARLRLGQFATELTTYGLDYANQLAVFHRVEEIFMPRKFFWRNLSFTIIGGASWWWWSLPSFIVLASLAELLGRLLSKTLLMKGGDGLAFAALYVPAAAFVVSYFRGSTVIFSNFSEQAATRRGSSVKFLVETAKIIFPFLLGLLAGHFNHR